MPVKSNHFVTYYASRSGVTVEEYEQRKADGQKFCPKCPDGGKWKPLNEFANSAGRYDGKHSYCSDCKTVLDKVRNEKKRAALASRALAKRETVCVVRAEPTHKEPLVKEIPVSTFNPGIPCRGPICSDSYAQRPGRTYAEKMRGHFF